jgi:hypothetical protein
VHGSKNYDYTAASTELMPVQNKGKQRNINTIKTHLCFTEIIIILTKQKLRFGGTAQRNKVKPNNRESSYGNNVNKAYRANKMVFIQTKCVMSCHQNTGPTDNTEKANKCLISIKSSVLPSHIQKCKD